MSVTAGLTTTIPIHDQAGRKIGEKEVATYQGLLAKAHEEGLKSIRTEVLQFPCRENGLVAIVRATVRTGKGTFTGIGDATSRNVAVLVAPHFLRMAETRAKARALRDAVNIGTVALEELGDLGEARVGPDEEEPPPKNGGSAAATGHEFHAMSGGQYRLLARLCAERGVPASETDSWMRFRLKVLRLEDATVEAASRLIDQLKSSAASSNGAAAA